MLAIGSLAVHSDFSNEISKTNPNIWFEFNQLNLAAEITGVFKEIFFVRLVVKSISSSVGRISAYDGTKSTSS